MTINRFGQYQNQRSHLATLTQSKKNMAQLPIVAALAAMCITPAQAELIENAADASKYPDESSVVVDPQQVLQCAKVQQATPRLACFDKVAKGEIVVEKKVPLDLAKTVNASLQEGKAVAVLANPTQVTASSDISEQDKTILQEVGVTKADVKRYTPLSLSYDLDEDDPSGVFSLRPYRPMFVMPVWYDATPNRDIHSPSHAAIRYNSDELQNLDTKMQISLKAKLMQDAFDTNADVWFGYTQQSYWQIYNPKYSRPFRSTDYQPEIFVTQPIVANLPWGGDLRLLGAGLVHQSNGQGGDLSRSWNRAYVMAGMEWNKLTVIPRLWAIGNDNEDNADIGDYMGYGDVRWLYTINDDRSVGGLLRYNPRTEKGALQLDYTLPLNGNMHAYLQFFHGYGENIQDYNHKSTNVGIGLTFNDFKGL